MILCFIFIILVLFLESLFLDSGAPHSLHFLGSFVLLPFTIHNKRPSESLMGPFLLLLLAFNNDLSTFKISKFTWEPQVYCKVPLKTGNRHLKIIVNNRHEISLFNHLKTYSWVKSKFYYAFGYGLDFREVIRFIFFQVE